jgi:putative ABC transport system permease protein
VKGAWRIAARNLRRQRRRNVVTALAVALGYAGLVILLGYAGWMERLLRAGSVYGQHRGHLAVYAPGGLKRAEARPSRYALTVEAQDAIVAALRADPRVEEVGRYLVGSGIAGNGCRSFQIRAVGLEPELERRLAAEPEVLALRQPAGAGAAARSVLEAPGVDAPVVLAPVLARSLEKHRIAAPPVTVLPARTVTPAAAPAAPPPGQRALDCTAADVQDQLAADPFVQLGGRTVDGQFGAVEAQVVGVFHPASTEETKTALLAPLDLVQRLFDTDRVTYVAAYLRDHRDAAAVERDLVARLHRGGLEVSVHRFDDRAANPYFVGTLSFLEAMVFFIMLVLVCVVAFSLLNATTLAVLERTREMGTLRSLGFTRGALTGLFLREASLLTATAMAAGAALAGLARLLVAAARIRFVPPGYGTEVVLQLLPPASAWLGSAALLLVLAVSTTWIAVRRAVRADVSVLLSEVTA